MFSGCGRQEAEQEVQIYCWNNRGNDVLTSEMKTDSQSEDSFVRNFLKTYKGDMETKEELVEKGCDSVLIRHPFGCLVSHVCERGILQSLHARFPEVSIQTIEYDYDQSKTLRESRILLAIS